MIAPLALLAAACWQDDGPAGRQIEFSGPEGDRRFLMQINDVRLDPPKTSPKHGWVFEWAVGCLGRQETGDAPYKAKFRVFSQQRKTQGDPAPMVGQMALRLWDFNVRKLRLEHNPAANFGIIDFYLCFGGKAGGEQLFDTEGSGAESVRVNTIYIYAVQTFTEPLEMAREVAHEYGHATLPPIGGYQAPEAWATGYLGEKLYLTWLSQEMASGRLGPMDAMGATATQIAGWLQRNVDPLVSQAAVRGPDVLSLARTDAKGMDAYLGLAMYAQAILPTNVFARSLKLTGSNSAVDYPKSIVLAASEPDSYALNIPERFKGKPIWIPLGKGKLSGLARVVKTQGDWAQIVADATAVGIKNR